jgi:hypothetical protein
MSLTHLARQASELAAEQQHTSGTMSSDMILYVNATVPQGSGPEPPTQQTAATESKRATVARMLRIENWKRMVG